MRRARSAQSEPSVPDRWLDRTGVGSSTFPPMGTFPVTSGGRSLSATRRERRTPPGGLIHDGAAETMRA
ncbi:hypothetical protein C8Q80DRAFT_1191405 [Daedaleopsis nitida]|nr:hypothetical protein C8Q80DRAFT_1191405 [Daedaleopsis nitida]